MAPTVLCFSGAVLSSDGSISRGVGGKVCTVCWPTANLNLCTSIARGSLKERSAADFVDNCVSIVRCLVCVSVVLW